MLTNKLLVGPRVGSSAASPGSTWDARKRVRINQVQRGGVGKHENRIPTLGGVDKQKWTPPNVGMRLLHLPTTLQWECDFDDDGKLANEHLKTNDCAITDVIKNHCNALSIFRKRAIRPTDRQATNSNKKNVNANR